MCEGLSDLASVTYVSVYFNTSFSKGNFCDIVCYT